MTSSVERLLAFHGTSCFDSRENMRVRQREARVVYGALTAAEQAELVEAVLAQGDSEDDQVWEVLCCLACFQPGSLSPFHQTLLERRILYPGVIYHGAAAGTAARLMEFLEDDEGYRNLALEALAWVGDETVQRSFAEWRERPPQWASTLYVPPDQYSHEAGWELTQNGKRRDLFQKTALPLEPPVAGQSGGSAVRTGVPGQRTCPWCGRRLTVLLAFDDIGVVLPSHGSGSALVLTCDVCTAYGTVSAKQDHAGATAWHRANTKPSYLPADSSDWDAFPELPLVLAGGKRHFLHAANWGMLPGVNFSQVGGLPTWIQDAEYPTCPDCSGTMSFIGQISNEDFREFGEGIYYAFHCRGCRVTATSYQQT